MSFVRKSNFLRLAWGVEMKIAWANKSLVEELRRAKNEQILNSASVDMKHARPRKGKDRLREIVV